MSMKALSFVAALCAASGPASAFCPAPNQTGNQAYDSFAQQQFYACLAQQQSSPAPQPYRPQQGGGINFGLLNTDTPAQIGRDAAAAQTRALQNELLRLQIEQTRRQLNQ